jgi:hypothetical protein
MPHRLLIYHSDSKTYKDILSKRLPLLNIDSAEHPQEAADVMEEVEILFSWQIPEDFLKRAKSLKWFFFHSGRKRESREERLFSRVRRPHEDDHLWRDDGGICLFLFSLFHSGPIKIFRRLEAQDLEAGPARSPSRKDDRRKSSSEGPQGEEDQGRSRRL